MGYLIVPSLCSITITRGSAGPIKRVPTTIWETCLDAPSQLQGGHVSKPASFVISNEMVPVPLASCHFIWQSRVTRFLFLEDHGKFVSYYWMHVNRLTRCPSRVWYCAMFYLFLSMMQALVGPRITRKTSDSAVTECRQQKAASIMKWGKTHQCQFSLSIATVGCI